MLLLGSVIILTLAKDVAMQSQALNITELNIELMTEFKLLDLDGDNRATEAEMEKFVYHQDKDRDGCITLSEFVRGHGHDNLRFVWALFNHFDHNNDGCLEHADQVDEFNEIDVNPKDGYFTIQELDAYYDRLYVKIGEPMDR